MQTYDFDEQRNIGDIGETLFCEYQGGMLTPYAEFPKLQHSGIDMFVDGHSIDIKTQRHSHRETGNIPIEVYSNLEQHKQGWYFTSKADAFVILFLNESHDGLYPNAYILYNNGAMREFVGGGYSEWREIHSKNDYVSPAYHSAVKLIPATMFPADVLFNFNPIRDDVTRFL